MLTHSVLKVKRENKNFIGYKHYIKDTYVTYRSRYKGRSSKSAMSKSIVGVETVAAVENASFHHVK